MICLENVRQLISNKRGETFAVILRALADLGYAVEHRILDARDFGLPQKRERVLIVGARGGFGDGGFAWPTRKIPMKPLAEILETAPPPRFYASARIRENRRRKHKAAQRPDLARNCLQQRRQCFQPHENKGGNVSSQRSVFLRLARGRVLQLFAGRRRTPSDPARIVALARIPRIVSDCLRRFANPQANGQRRADADGASGFARDKKRIRSFRSAGYNDE